MRTLVLGSALVGCLAFPASQVAQAAPGGTATAAESRHMADRFFRVKVNVYGRDDETWPEKDENVNRDYGPFEGVLTDASRDFSFQIPNTGWGGECRVEVIQTKAHLNNDGSIELTGSARLFEGTSEETDQLRAEKFFSVTVPRKTENQFHQVHLTWGGGDFADVKFWLTNVVNE